MLLKKGGLGFGVVVLTLGFNGREFWIQMGWGQNLEDVCWFNFETLLCFNLQREFCSEFYLLLCSTTFSMNWMEA
jgi:hypothetical protein